MISALGYVQCQIVFGKDGSEEIDRKDILENEYYTITVNHDGSFDIYEKESQTLYKNQGILVENGDDGDSFNYSPPREDLEVFSKDFTPEISITALV